MDDAFERRPHTDRVIAHLEALERGDIEKLMVFIPPQYGKSYLCSERFPTYALGRKPKRRMILISHTASLALEFGRTARALMLDPAYPFDTRLQPDSKAVGLWHTTAGGSMLSIGMGGALAGHAAEILGIDDPFSGPQDADSPAIQKHHWDFYTTVAQRRLQRKGLEYLLTTRWNERDLAGMILNSKAAIKWTILRLPAINENGSRLWPEGPAIPDTSLGEISTRHFQAIFMQDPQPDTGTVFRREWFEGAPRWTTWPEGLTTASGLDGASKPDASDSTEDHDWSAYVLWGTDGTRYFLRSGWHGKYEYPDLRGRCIGSFVTDKPDIAAVEDAASGTPLIQELRRSGVPLVAVPPRGSKELRAKSITPLFEAGLVVFPGDEVLAKEGRTWFDEYVTQHLRFGTGGAHDDYVDADYVALDRLQQRSEFSFASVRR